MLNADYIPDSIVLRWTLGILFILWGICWFGVGVYLFQSFTALEFYNFFDILKIIHLIFIEGTLAIIGGTGLILRKNIYWSIAFAIGLTTIFRSVYLLIMIWFNELNQSYLLALILGTLILFLVITFLLLLPIIRNQFELNRKNAITTLIIVSILLIDFLVL